VTSREALDDSDPDIVRLGPSFEIETREGRVKSNVGVDKGFSAEARAKDLTEDCGTDRLVKSAWPFDFEANGFIESVAFDLVSREGFLNKASALAIDSSDTETEHPFPAVLKPNVSGAG